MLTCATPSSRDDMRVVADAVLAQCDALDGAVDGIVGALATCQRTFDVERLSCRAGGDKAAANASRRNKWPR